MMSSVNNNMHASSQIDHQETCMYKLEDIEILDVIDVNDLICFISKEIMRDPIFFSCGHVFSRSACKEKYLETGKKICSRPDCSQPYTFLIEDRLIRKVVELCLFFIYKKKKQS